MNVLKNNDLRTLFDRYGFEYSSEPAPGYGVVTTLALNCMGSNDADLEFHDGHAVLEVLVDSDIKHLPKCFQTDYMLKIKMPIWVAEHIAQETTYRLKEEG